MKSKMFGSIIASVLCLNPDASEVFGGAGGQLLDTDTGSIDTSFPIVAADRYEMKIDKSELTSKDGKWTWSMELSTLSPSVDKVGNALPPGQKFFHRTLLTPTGKRDMTGISKDVAAICQAVPHLMTLRELPDRVGEFAGKTCVVKTQIEPEREDKNVAGKFYEERHSIKMFLKR